MWEAARKYSQLAYPGEKYPAIQENAKCVLCEQELNEITKTRLVNFENYITNDLELSATTVEETLQNTLNALPTQPNNETLTTSLRDMQLDKDKWLPVVTKVWYEINKVIENTKNKERQSFIHYEFPINTFEELNILVANLNAEIEQHREDAKNFDEKNLSTQIDNLKAKKLANGYIESIKKEILKLQKKQQINDLLASVNSKPVSIEAGNISKLVITEAFISRFQSELKLLGAESIKVELVKTRTEYGSTKHKIQLSNVDTQYKGIKVRKILSDGEQRIVSLAAFLADVTSKLHPIPFVFDDPISSLDQKYEEYVAKRLAKLSLDRQVIIFTHRLSLLGLLMDIDKVNFQCISIRSEAWGCGEPSDLPFYAKKPIAAMTKLKKERLVQANKVLDSNGSEEYYPLAKSICSEFRILLERMVEHDLLADKGKLYKIAEVNKEDCEKFEGWMENLSCYEHSQSTELPVEIPSPKKNWMNY